MLRYFIIVIITFFCLVNCKKKDQPKDKSELLTTGKWRLNDYGYDANNNSILDPTESVIDLCQKDDVYKFNSGGQGLWDEGTNDCNPAQLQQEVFSWSLSDNQTKLTVDGPLYIIRLNNATIKVLNNSNLEVQEISLAGPTSFRVIVKYVKVQ